MRRNSWLPISEQLKGLKIIHLGAYLRYNRDDLREWTPNLSRISK
jgi:hypothetical protein